METLVVGDILQKSL